MYWIFLCLIPYYILINFPTPFPFFEVQEQLIETYVFFFPTVSWLFACKHTCKPLFPALRRVIVRPRIASLSRNGCCCVHTYVKRYVAHVLYIYIVQWCQKHEFSGDISLYFTCNTFEKHIDNHWRKFNVFQLVSAPPLYTYKPCNKMYKLYALRAIFCQNYYTGFAIRVSTDAFFFFLLYFG